MSGRPWQGLSPTAIDQLFSAAYADITDGSLAPRIGYSMMLELCQEARRLRDRKDGPVTDQSERRALAIDELDDLRKRMVEDVNQGRLDAATAYRLEMEAIQIAARLTDAAAALPRDLFRLPPELLP